MRFGSATISSSVFASEGCLLCSSPVALSADAKALLCFLVCRALVPLFCFSQD